MEYDEKRKTSTHEIFTNYLKRDLYELHLRKYDQG